MDCKTCKEARATVPFIVHEGDMTRLERVNKRWFIAWIITFVLFIASWAGFIWYESQWEVVETSVTQEADWESGNVIINGTGGVNINGEGETDSYDSDSD